MARPWKPRCPFDSLASQAATPEIRAAILELMGGNIYPYLITNTGAGYPYSRPLICVNEGFEVWMVSRTPSKKLGHLARGSRAALLWVDPPRSVLLQGEVSVHKDEDAVADFFLRYARKNPERTRQPTENVPRVVLRLTPTFCRADWFAGFTPVVLRF
jgi:hypothetical protein